VIAVFSFYQETSTSPILSGEEIQQKGKKRKHNEEETIQKIVEVTKQSRLETVMVRCSLKWEGVAIGHNFERDPRTYQILSIVN
jgi:hypothetical protein